MESEIEGNPQHLYGPIMNSVGKKRGEWDLNDWRWNGNLFTATRLNSGTPDCTSRQFFPMGSEFPTQTGLSNSFSSGSDERNLVESESERGKRELEKRRRDGDHANEDFTEEARTLNLKLGGQVYPVTQSDVDRWEVKNGKKTKVVGPSSNRAVCQVDDCRVDLSDAKDYHRRHKVCDVHSKATKALVGNVMQRFCQQCSRFHALQEFDEGKRSCRRRLAGHNKRRRKTHPESVATGTPANDERDSNYLLISLLKLLSNTHANNTSDISNDQDLLCQLLRSLANVAGVVSDRNLTGLLSGSRDLQNAGTSDRNPTEDAAFCRNTTALSSGLVHERILGNDNVDETFRNVSPTCFTPVLATRESCYAERNEYYSNGGKSKVNNFDLNDAYDDTQDCAGAVQILDAHAPINHGEASPGCPSWIICDPLKSSPPNTSGNTASTSTLSPSSTSGETQSRTDRIVFKLFGKDPGDLPFLLRKQILDWLSQSPTDIESYIRPGCVILTVYLRMDISTWDQVCYDLTSSLEKLVNSPTSSFWRTGWIYTRVRHHMAFVYDGHVVLDTPVPRVGLRSCRIVNAKPVAVCASDMVTFSVKGMNISCGTSRLLCAFEGKYLVNESCDDVVEEFKSFDIQTLNFSCVIPNIIGRGFIEVEDHSFSSSFFPFIVAEKDVCLEIRTLESVIEAVETSDVEHGQTRDQALEFLHEMGWLLHRHQSKLRLNKSDPNTNMFPFKRFSWLVTFSVEHDWCAVVKKLLNILFDDVIDSGEFVSITDALLDIGLLHWAVKRNSRAMVEVLLHYCPDGVLNEPNLNNKDRYVFKPDVKGPRGLTPIHIAAELDGSDQVLDALTDDPGQVGVKAWKSARDNAGLTPCEYACVKGHYTYIHLVQRKINKRSIVGEGGNHHVIEIPGCGSSVFERSNSSSTKHKAADTDTKQHVGKVGGMWTEGGKQLQQCRQCELKMEYGKGRRSMAIYRPAMLSMLAIAAVCVCVALYFKTSPEVKCIYSPFRWEMLEYGSS